MRALEKKTLTLKLAEALLLYKGEISVRDIEAIPLLDDIREAEMIARHLRSKFKTTQRGELIKLEGGGKND